MIGIDDWNAIDEQLGKRDRASGRRASNYRVSFIAYLNAPLARAALKEMLHAPISPIDGTGRSVAIDRLQDGATPHRRHQRHAQIATAGVGGLKPHSDVFTNKIAGDIKAIDRRTKLQPRSGGMACDEIPQCFSVCSPDGNGWNWHIPRRAHGLNGVAASVVINYGEGGPGAGCSPDLFPKETSATLNQGALPMQINAQFNIRLPHIHQRQRRRGIIRMRPLGWQTMD